MLWLLGLTFPQGSWSLSLCLCLLLSSYTCFWLHHIVLLILCAGFGLMLHGWGLSDWGSSELRRWTEGDRRWRGRTGMNGGWDGKWQSDKEAEGLQTSSFVPDAWDGFRMETRTPLDDVLLDWCDLWTCFLASWPHFYTSKGMMPITVD